MENVSSEQELKELLEEGKITEEEYTQLRQAMSEKPGNGVKTDGSDTKTSVPKSGMGKVALVFLLAGLLVPLLAITAGLISGTAGSTRISVILIFPFLILGLACLLIAFILGIIGWSSTQGKIAALGVPAIGVFAFLVGVLILPLAFVSSYRVKQDVQQKYIISHAAWPVDSLEGLLTKSGVEIDNSISAEGTGALKITAGEDTIVRLFETGPISIENRILYYSAKVRCENLTGRAYLEMWCNVGGNEYFSRGLDHAISGTTEWITLQTPFRLEKGQMPADIKLNIVIEGAGVVWIDDIKLFSSPLN